ncbi:hypothetical protein Poli38472_014009 [Pythium oligandrum]|uniref:Serine protease n=1 Tax=Pythium oligandrum TaxID=41045 RepID=A0A8K1CNA0_PYTOL|nr:hypothetical protein Poli38472_014009 [Pythium oligandrum]|eukprot:TMW66697.1 hypothetical protein Poli38472_014009 [Pythium oligandrum]
MMRLGFLALACSMGAVHAATSPVTSLLDQLKGQIVGNSIAITNGTLTTCEPKQWTYYKRSAPYLSVHFKHFSLGDDDVLTISSPDGNETHKIDPPDGVTTFSSSRVPGPTAVITFTPGSCSPDNFGLEIDVLEYTFGDTVMKEDVCGGANQNVAAVCYKNREGVDPKVYTSSFAVARLIKTDPDGPRSACTGWLLGSQGHLMTNHHCIKDADEANRTNFEFMVQSPTCDNSCKSLGDCRDYGKEESIGSDFIYANEKYDYAIVKLRKKPCLLNGKYGYFSLRRAEPVEKEPIYMVQHPNGGGKMITFEQDIDNTGSGASNSGTMPAIVEVVNDENELGDFWTSYFADTEPGSSGSPVVSATSHQVIALHSNGACKNSGAPSHLIIKDIEANNLGLPADAFA